MLKFLSRLVFKISGWTLDDHLKGQFNRCVMIAAPHTSNWDLLYSRCAFYLMDLPVRFTVKKEWMRFPVKGFLTALGAIAIDRSPKEPGHPRPSMTESMVELYQQNKEMIIMVTPEGTRSKVTKWKTGFYHAAVGAGVPIGLGYLDYKTKTAGIARTIMPSGDMQKDMKEIMHFYQSMTAKYPEKFSVDLDYA